MTDNMPNYDWGSVLPRVLDEDAMAAARARQNSLTKPPGALGMLETVAIQLAGMQGQVCPNADKVWISVFAGDHGVAAEGVSAFPQAVTAEMVKNFARGGSAISVLARELGARLEVINLGTVGDASGAPGVTEVILGRSTANFTRETAMTTDQTAHALTVGAESVTRALEVGSTLFIGGEMGIANTTATTAIACALLNETPEALAGPGTGLDHAGVARKAEVIRRALALHGTHLDDPLQVLRRLGGFEIAALTGAYLACAQMGLAALIDGAITTSAALLAERIAPGTARWFLYAHNSAEPVHSKLLAALEGKPLIDLGMRLGEGSGAGVVVPLIRMACALHAQMATFAEAGVSERSA